MNFLEFLRPLKQNKWLFSLLFLIFSWLSYWGIQQIPSMQKITIYFTIKPLQTENDKFINLDPLESSMKVAEMIAGWAKNPAFRNKILDNAGIQISNFKRKIAAQKQNRTNVFWTIKLYGDEQAHAEKLIAATLQTFQSNFDDFNAKNSFPFGITQPSTAIINQNIPLFWKILAALFLGKVLALFTLYGWKSLSGKVNFPTQVRTLFPRQNPLKITQKIGKHDAKLLEQFILTFDSPRLISTFAKADKHFALSNAQDIDLSTETPILLVKLGATNINELENLKAIFGEEVGIVIFEK